METIGELINLFAAVLLLSVAASVVLSIRGGRTDVSHLMLPAAIQRHPLSFWGTYTTQSAKLTPAGYFKLELRSGSGESWEMLIHHLRDTFVSCLYRAGWPPMIARPMGRPNVAARTTD